MSRARVLQLTSHWTNYLLLMFLVGFPSLTFFNRVIVIFNWLWFGIKLGSQVVLLISPTGTFTDIRTAWLMSPL